MNSAKNYLKKIKPQQWTQQKLLKKNTTTLNLALKKSMIYIKTLNSALKNIFIASPW